MKIYQSRIFENKVKKLSKQEKDLLDDEINKIAKNSLIGEEKKGDLRGVYVYKFIMQSLLYLLSYRKIKLDLELIMIGPHENYYRELKSYLKKSLSRCQGTQKSTTTSQKHIISKLKI
jgi:mRNA interferase RelE/StbE